MSITPFLIVGNTLITQGPCTPDTPLSSKDANGSRLLGPLFRADSLAMHVDQFLQTTREFILRKLVPLRHATITENAKYRTVG